MKKMILMALLVGGCATAAPPVPAYTPEAPAPVAEAPVKNPYLGAFSFLKALTVVSVDEFQQACGQFGGEYYHEEDFFTCSKGLSGFSIEVIDGTTTGSSLLVPGTGGQLLADALAGEVGQPDILGQGMATWYVEGGTLYFANVDDIAYIAVYEPTL